MTLVRWPDLGLGIEHDRWFKRLRPDISLFSSLSPKCSLHRCLPKANDTIEFAISGESTTDPWEVCPIELRERERSIQ
jgi:hypothetical protein